MEQFAMPSAEGFDVIVCGSLHLDIMVKGAHLPRLDETAVGSEWSMVCGGKGGNQAVMAARMGARTAMIGRVGRDDFGQQLLSNMDRFNVDRTEVGVDDNAGSGMSVAILNTQGDYGAVIVSGANLKLDPGECARQWQELGGAKVLVLQNEIPDAVNAAIAKAAKDAGALVVLNAAPARQLGEDLLQYVDVLVVNRVEAEMMSGAPVTNIDTAMAVLPSLGARRRDIIITLGGEGLVMQGRDASPTFLAPHAVKVASTHGAGDCFVGVLSAQLAAGRPLADSCETANQKAAFFVALSEDTRASFDLAAIAADPSPRNILA
jgi:ribokinase